MIGVCAVLSVAVSFPSGRLRVSVLRFFGDKPTRDIWRTVGIPAPKKVEDLTSAHLFARSPSSSRGLSGGARFTCMCTFSPACFFGREMEAWIGFDPYFPRAFAYKSTLPSLCLIAAGLAAGRYR